MFFKYVKLMVRSNGLKFRRLSTCYYQLSVYNISRDYFKCLPSKTGKNLLQFSPSTFALVRGMSSEQIKNIDIPEYLKMKEDPKTTIIDVREKSEIAETGILPGGINIPTAEVSDALQKDPAIFEKTYKIAKPSNEDRIIFSCRSGKRSLAAALVAQKLGYENVLNLAGGWLAYEEYMKK